MEVTAKRLKVRHYPEIDDVPAVTELKRGDRVTLLGISGKWSYVKWGNGGHDEQGYVFSRHIKPAGALLYFATEEVNVRSEANSSSRILGVLQAGEAVNTTAQAALFTASILPKTAQKATWEAAWRRSLAGTT